MNMQSLEQPARPNPVQIGKILKLCLFVAPLVAAALSFVFLKNQQFALGEKIRKTEISIRETRLENEVLLAKVTAMTSRRALTERIGSEFINMVPITDNNIARLTPPTEDSGSSALRTAFNGASRQ